MFSYYTGACIAKQIDAVARTRRLATASWRSSIMGLCVITVDSAVELSPGWRHQMETFPALLAFCTGNSPVTGEFPEQSQWRGALMFSWNCAWTYSWANNRDAGDLRRYRAHYDVIVMQTERQAQITDLLIEKESKAKQDLGYT